MVKLIGITGCSGSGKTTFAKKMAKKIGRSAKIISTNQYFKGIPKSVDIREFDFDSPNNFNLELFECEIMNLYSCESGTTILINKRNKLIKVDEKTVIIIEGVFTFISDKINKLFSEKYFLDVPLDKCLERRINQKRRKEFGIEELRVRWDKFIIPAQLVMREKCYDFCEILGLDYIDNY